MYDLKELEKNQSNQEGANLEISDRSYYSNHLTDSVFKTKISYNSFYQQILFYKLNNKTYKYLKKKF